MQPWVCTHTLTPLSEQPATSSLTRGIPVVEADGAGVSLILVDGGSFFNSSQLGASTLSAPHGAWQVWSQNPANDNRGGIAYNFKQYNAAFGITTPAESDNGVFYTTAPVLAASLLPVVKQYNATTLATISPSNYSLAGVIDNDTVTLNDPATGTFSDKNVATNKTITIDGLTETAMDGSARVYGYQLASTLVAPGAGTITPAPVIAVTSASNKVYFDGTRVAAATTALSGVFAGDNVSLAGLDSYTFAQKDVGNGIAVSISPAHFGRFRRRQLLAQLQYPGCKYHACSIGRDLLDRQQSLRRNNRRCRTLRQFVGRRPG